MHSRTLKLVVTNQEKTRIMQCVLNQSFSNESTTTVVSSSQQKAMRRTAPIFSSIFGWIFGLSGASTKYK